MDAVSGMGTRAVPRLQLRLSYEFETRGANDPDRQYDAHSTVFAIERRW